MINIKQRFQKGKFIGRGSYGETYEVYENDPENQKKYAAKIYLQQINDISSDGYKEIKNELGILYKLNHASIIKFIGYNMKNFNDEPKPTIIMELGQNGSLRDLIISVQRNERPKQWTNTKIMINIYGIASGLLYLHAHNIIHRDLKPENILLNEYLYPKITDFGLSRICQNADEISNFSIKGTPHYMAPENFDGNFLKASDVYSFAILLYEIITNDNPNKKLNYAQIAIKAVKYGFNPQFTDEFPESYKNLILQCGSNDPEKRPSFQTIVNMIENDKQFILPDADETEFNNYIDYIKEYETTFLSQSLIIQFEDYMKTKNSTVPKVTLKTLKLRPNECLYPYDLYLTLSNDCKRLVDEAEKNSDVKFIIGKFSIEEENGFPKNTEIGIKYLKKSITEGCVQSILYYCQMQISGKRIPRNIKKAKLRLNKIDEDKKNGEFYMLYGQVMRKEKDYESAKKFFNKAIKRGNAKAMNNYGKMLLYGEGCDASKESSLEYFQMAQRNNYKKANDYISLINVNKINPKLILNVLLVGDTSVGKTILMASLEFRPFFDTVSTAGIDFDVIYYGKTKEDTVKFRITDTAGQEKYRNAITPMLFRNKDVIFLCYSKEYEMSIPYWIDLIRKNAPNCQTMLIETKSDLLSEEQKKSSRVHGMELMDRYNCYNYVLCSSKTKEGIKNILKYAAELAIPITETTNNSVDITSSNDLNQDNMNSTNSINETEVRNVEEPKTKKKCGC